VVIPSASTASKGSPNNDNMTYMTMRNMRKCPQEREMYVSLLLYWSQSSDYFKFRQIIDNIWDIVQDRDMVTIEDLSVCQSVCKSVLWQNG